MEWPAQVHLSEIQSRLLNDGVPVERAMRDASEAGLVPVGNRYHIQRSQGDLFLYPQGAGWFIVGTE